MSKVLPGQIVGRYTKLPTGIRVSGLIPAEWLDWIEAARDDSDIPGAKDDILVSDIWHADGQNAGSVSSPYPRSSVYEPPSIAHGNVRLREVRLSEEEQRSLRESLTDILNSATRKTDTEIASLVENNSLLTSLMLDIIGRLADIPELDLTKITFTPSAASTATSAKEETSPNTKSDSRGKSAESDLKRWLKDGFRLLSGLFRNWKRR